MFCCAPESNGNTQLLGYNVGDEHGPSGVGWGRKDIVIWNITSYF